MSAPTVTVAAPRELSDREEAVGRYEGVRQYSLGQIVAVWAAATLPMGVLAWIVAPALEDNLTGAGNVPMAKALLLVLTAGLIWQGVMVAGLVWLEQRSLALVDGARGALAPFAAKPQVRPHRREAVAHRRPVAAPICGGPVPHPSPSSPVDRDMEKFLDSDSGQAFLSGNWRWYALLLVLWIFNTVLGEELLFRGLLLPRMNRVFGRGDWPANGVLFCGVPRPRAVGHA